MNDQNLNELFPSLMSSSKMPVFFIGHGSPMNAIQDNPFTQSLKAMRQTITEIPQVILVVSAHWNTRGSYVNNSPMPKMVYDFSGFPDELYDVQYPAMGAPELAQEISDAVPEIRTDQRWGLDHGAWSILVHMFPDAEIPVLQLSVDVNMPAQSHFKLAAELKELRNRGVLVIASGNIVHNLKYLSPNEDEVAYDWAIDFDEWVKEKVTERAFEDIFNYNLTEKAANLSVPTPEHYYPMLYALGLMDDDDEIKFTYEKVFSSISMRCFRIG
jgi:4,5-DOPA dioxygenase extradiol